MTASVIQPGTIETPSGGLPELRLPERHVFETRAARLEALAAGHALGDYLRFLARLARAQQAALTLMRGVLLPDTECLAQCREHGMPPLGAQAWTRSPLWRAVLRQILAELAAAELPAPARMAIGQLQEQDDAGLEHLADRLLAGDYAGLDRASAPLIAAALQVYWLHMATSLGSAAFAPLPTSHLCPVCGSEPVASVVRIGGAEQGLRYLHCSLCNAEWHAVRIKCVYCDSTKGISYYGIEGGSPAIKAEHCKQCASYLKILYMEKDSGVEAVADDVASLALDVLMAESGFGRNGVNPYLIGGDA
jgi:FdhE protein